MTMKQPKINSGIMNSFLQAGDLPFHPPLTNRQIERELLLHERLNLDL
jgi:hypothetical protein